jgi:hypothetical protein
MTNASLAKTSNLLGMTNASLANTSNLLSTPLVAIIETRAGGKSQFCMCKSGHLPRKKKLGCMCNHWNLLVQFWVACATIVHVIVFCTCSICFAHRLHVQHFFCTCNVQNAKRLHVQLGLDCTCSSAMFRSKTIARAVGIGLHMQELCSVCTSKLHELLLHVQNLACCSFSLFLPLPE